MNQYHKIQTVFLRDPATNYKTLLEGQYALPEFEYLANNQWTWTEKVDGTNIRVIWDGTAIVFGGKTDNAQIPASLVNRLSDTFFPLRDTFLSLPPSGRLRRTVCLLLKVLGSCCSVLRSISR